MSWFTFFKINYSINFLYKIVFVILFIELFSSVAVSFTYLIFIVIWIVGIENNLNETTIMINYGLNNSELNKFPKLLS